MPLANTRVSDRRPVSAVVNSTTALCTAVKANTESSLPVLKESIADPDSGTEAR